MKEIVVRSGITPVGSSKYRISRLRYHLLAYSIGRQARLHGLESRYLIRCDDTDSKTANRSYLEAYLSVLDEIGVRSDMTPYDKDRSGYRLFQSERTEIYWEYINKLLVDKLAYYDASGAIFFDTVAFKNRFHSVLTEGRILVQDISMGNLLINISTSLNDRSGQTGFVPFPLTRSDGSPLFNIASPIDDALLGVTHVVRDRGKLNLLHTQEMIRIALGFPELTYVHAPQLTDLAGKKLVSHDYCGDATYQNLIQRGIFSSALVSYLLSTVAGPAEAFYSSIDDFSYSANFSRIHRADTVFTPSILEKHNFNALQNAQIEEYVSTLKNFLNTYDKEAERLLISNISIVQMLYSSKRSFNECAKIIKYILSPQYNNPYPELEYFVRQILIKLEAFEASTFSADDLVATILKYSTHDKSDNLRALRYVLTGEVHGYNLNEIIKYLCENGLLKARVSLAKSYFQTL